MMEELNTVECLRCHGKWQRRVTRPKKCPCCGSLFWDVIDPKKLSKEEKLRIRSGK